MLEIEITDIDNKKNARIVGGSHFSIYSPDWEIERPIDVQKAVEIVSRNYQEMTGVKVNPKLHSRNIATFVGNFYELSDEEGNNHLRILVEPGQINVACGDDIGKGDLQKFNNFLRTRETNLKEIFQ